jgi:hypothetical protein
MRLLSGHENQVPALEVMRFSRDRDFGLSFQHLHQRIEWGYVLAQPLPFVECKDRYTAAGFFTISRLTIEPSW